MIIFALFHAFAMDTRCRRFSLMPPPPLITAAD